MQCIEERTNTGQKCTWLIGEAMRETVEITSHEAVTFGRGIGETVAGKDFVGDAAVRATGREYTLEREADPEFFDQRQLHCSLASTTGAQHGSIDIKEQHALRRGHEFEYFKEYGG